MNRAKKAIVCIVVLLFLVFLEELSLLGTSLCF